MTAACSLVAFPLLSRAQSLTIATLAGSPPEASADGTGLAARFASPCGITTDSAGNLYVADTDNHTIRKITPAGVVSTLAGLAGVSGSTDGTAGSARFYQPQGVAVDGAGNVYVADTGNYTIRKVTPGGVVTTLAGSPGTAGSADASSNNASFYEPEGIGVTSDGLLIYVADTWNHTIRKVTSAGAVTTLAGFAGTPGSTDATGGSARFNQPQGIAVDGTGNVYVGDTANGTIRMVTSGGTVTTIAGSAGNYGSLDGVGSSARFYQPSGVALDSQGNIYVADTFNNTVRQIAPGGIVSTWVGLAGNFGSADGTNSGARFSSPQGVAVIGATGHAAHVVTGATVYVADTGNGTIRQVLPGEVPGGVVSTFAGEASAGSANATGSQAQFFWAAGAAMNSSGNIYVGDTWNHTVRVVTPSGVVTNLAGAAGSPGSADGQGPFARFNGPQGVAADSDGNLYVADSGNNTIRLVDWQGHVSTLAGTPGVAGSQDGSGAGAQFYGPQAVAVDPVDSTVYVADTFNHTIRMISAGVVRTLAGLPGYPGARDGTGTNATRFCFPGGVAEDIAGNVYVADTGNHTVRELSPSGTVTTLAGMPGVFGSADGTNSGARFNAPAGIVVDGSGNLYVLDMGNQALRKVAPFGTNWVVSTVAGLPEVAGSADGTGSAARFNLPVGLAANSAGAFCVMDTGNNTMRAALLLLDINLRVYDGVTTNHIGAVAAGPGGQLTSPVRIRKNGITYGIPLVPTNSPNASNLRIQTSAGVQAWPKLP